MGYEKVDIIFSQLIKCQGFLDDLQKANYSMLKYGISIHFQEKVPSLNQFFGDSLFSTGTRGDAIEFLGVGPFRMQVGTDNPCLSRCCSSYYYSAGAICKYHRTGSAFIAFIQG